MTQDAANQPKLNVTQSPGDPDSNASRSNAGSDLVVRYPVTYQAVVKRLTLKIFGLVNDQQYDKVVASCIPDVTHQFGGHHALGGKRYGTTALRRWFDRLGRLVPSLQLHVKEIWVKGFPWNTVVIARWVGDGTFPDGSLYENHGVHIVHIRWGKVASIDANEDSEMVAKMMNALVAAGVEEAGAPPLT